MAQQGSVLFSSLPEFGKMSVRERVSPGTGSEYKAKLTPSQGIFIRLFQEYYVFVLLR